MKTIVQNPSGILVPGDQIEVYMDESYPQNHSFAIYVALFGPLGTGRYLEDEGQKLVHKHQKTLQTFTEFKGSKLTEKNWSRLSPIYEDLIVQVKTLFARQTGFRGLITIDAESHLKSNLKIVQAALNGAITQNAPAADTKRVEAASGEASLLWWLSIRKNLLSHDGKDLYIYPDNSDTSAKRLDEIWSLASSSASVMYKRGDFLGMLANSVDKARVQFFKKHSISLGKVSDAEIKEIVATRSESSFAVQACDIISHLFLSYLRAEAGSSEKIHQLKASLLNSHIDIGPCPFLPSLSWDGNDVVCKDSKLSGNIEIFG